MSKFQQLQHFSDFFQDCEDDYVIIGGIAADISLQENDISFRATKDIDIVILTNSSTKLNTRILEYVKLGNYQSKETIHGKQYFRFSDPNDTIFPKIIEIFARNETHINLEDEQYTIPIVANQKAEKLSAILLDDEYFELIRKNCIKSKLGFSIINPLATICLKARAFRELSERKQSGDKTVNSNSIKKHKNDIIRMTQILDDSDQIILETQVSKDLKLILQEIENSTDDQAIKQLVTVPGVTKSDLVKILKTTFSITE